MRLMLGKQNIWEINVWGGATKCTTRNPAGLSETLCAPKVRVVASMRWGPEMMRTVLGGGGEG